MVELSAFYPNPVPGFIATGIVASVLTTWAIIVALVNFGPLRYQRASDTASPTGPAGQPAQLKAEASESPAGSGVPFEASATAASLPTWWRQDNPARAPSPAAAGASAVSQVVPLEGEPPPTIQLPRSMSVQPSSPAEPPALSPLAAPVSPPLTAPAAPNSRETLVMGTVSGSVTAVALLTVEQGPDAGLRVRVELDRPGFLGRATDNDILVTDPATSRRHTRFGYRDGGFIVTDLGSANGTILNGERVVEAHIKAGDRIKIGQNELLVTIA